MSAPLRLVVFDMDGTLIDSAAFIQRAMIYACETAGHRAPTPQAVRSIIGLSLPQAVSKLMPDLAEAEVLDAAELYKKCFIELREKQGEGNVSMYAGAHQALLDLHGRDEVLLGLATGKAMRGVEHSFKQHDIGHFFQTVQSSDGHPSKPHPSMLEQTLRDTGAEAHHAVMIGDTSYDIEMGVAAGFMTIGVRWGYHSDDILTQSGADVLIDDYSQLKGALEQLWARS